MAAFHLPGLWRASNKNARKGYSAALWPFNLSGDMYARQRKNAVYFKQMDEVDNVTT